MTRKEVQQAYYKRVRYAPQKKWKETHLEEVKTYNREYARGWRKLNPIRTKTINTRQKIKQLHGSEGLVFLSKSSGLCSKCGKKCLDPQTLQGFDEGKYQTSWMIHDIDFDRSNRSKENFALLCSECSSKFHAFFIREVPKNLKRELFQIWMNS
jgi:hypothetical protein